MDLPRDECDYYAGDEVIVLATIAYDQDGTDGHVQIKDRNGENASIDSGKVMKMTSDIKRFFIEQQIAKLQNELLELGGE